MMLGRVMGFLGAVQRSRHGRPVLPRLLTYTATFACNARCVMCDSWRLPPQQELTPDEIDRIFAQLPRMDAVRLTGGEPLLRKDFAEIAHLAERRLRPLLLHVTSNGWLTDRLVQFCEDPRRAIPLQLLLSIDGVEEKHDQIRGRRQAWNHVMETIRALAPRQKSLRLSLAVNQTIVDAEGLDQYRLLREALRPYGVRNRVVVAYEASATYHPQRQVELAPKHAGEFVPFGTIGRRAWVDFFDRVQQDLHEVSWGQRMAARYYLSGIRNRLLHGEGLPNPRCVALGAHLRIFPDGDVPTCQFQSRVVGNLRRQPFREIWKGEPAQMQRAWVRTCPGCWAECEVLPNAIYTLDLLRQLAHRRHRQGDDFSGAGDMATRDAS
jgi:MoaA/NifB/PqqE/SkfB family radical SAM enzyme